MNTYDFSSALKMPDGTEVVEGGSTVILSNTLGNLLLGKTPGIDSLKAIGFAVQLSNSKSLSIDDSDKKKLRDIIESSEFGNLVKAALIGVLESPKKEEVSDS